MALLQALLALITKSAGKILNAIFGWAVHALFGQTSAKQQTFLSVLVAAAVAWPVLVAGVIAPKTAALVLALVPIPHWVPSWTVRVVWLALAILIPLALGLAIAKHAPADTARKSFVHRLLLGYPMTIGLAGAFLIMFVSVPVMRLVAIARKLASADVPLLTTTASYHEVATLTVEVLNRHGFALRATKPGWWVRAPTRLLRFFAGDSFRAFVPGEIEHYVSVADGAKAAALTVSFYASGVLVQGPRRQTTWAHGLIAEAIIRSEALHTFDPRAQALEKEIRQVWQGLTAAQGKHDPLTEQRVTKLARSLEGLDVEFDDWQVVYRQLLQLDRAAHGREQLLDRQPEIARRKEDVMVLSKTEARGEERPAQARVATADAPTTQLIADIGADMRILAEKHWALAVTELKADVARDLSAVRVFGIGIVAALLGLNALVMAGVLAVAIFTRGWIAGLLVAGALLVVAAATGIFAYSRVGVPMARTRRALEKDVVLAREHVS